MYRTFTLRAIVVVLLAAVSGACFGFENTLTGPTSQNGSYVGSWTSSPLTGGFPTRESCGNLKWTVTSQQGNNIAGNFEATCAGGIVLNGTASGTIAESIVWTASGNATQGSLTCPFTLSGTGAFQGTSAIVVTYAGTACGVPLNGTETIRR
jgi:hypothetical protein